MIEVGSDFSGIGSFNQALNRMGIPHRHVFACDKDKFARKAYLANYGEPEYFPEDVYDREIPEKPLGIYMTSPPCQTFSIAGKRDGEEDERGILFYNSHEFIEKNRPRYFVFENVKGLLSHDKRNKNSAYGRTFNKWLEYLGGKSINGQPVVFPHEKAVPYHIYHTVLNAKDYGIPQNRERVFIVGIRDDSDNDFSWPKPFHLVKRLKDVLEDNVDEKYTLSDKMLSYLLNRKDNFNNGKVGFKSEGDIANCINASSKSLDISDNIIIELLNGKNPQGNYADRTTFVQHSENEIGNCVTSNYKKGVPYNVLIEKISVRIKSATSKGYETATVNDSINFSVPNSETRRGRVGKGVAQTLDTACNQGVLERNRIRRLTPRECLRSMDFPDTFEQVVSDSQTYKQAGNSICVGVLAGILERLKLDCGCWLANEKCKCQ